MEQTQSESIYQIITKLLDGKSQTLNFNSPIIPISLIKSKLQTLTSIPINLQLLVSNGKTLYDDDVVSPNAATVHLLLRLRGGKGGFGSLLRGAATKAGQKKTNNFDACRDMSGRRLRHVNAEKKMEEWLAEEKERKLEKVAEDFLKKNAKSVKKKGGGDGAEKYVDKYRKDSAKCMEDVEKSVRESLSGAFSKRKGLEGEDGGGLKSKKLKIWMGKRKADDSDSDSDSDDMDEEDSDDEMGDENEKSGVTNNENRSDSNKEPNGSLASVNGGKVEGESSVGCSSESASEEEKETVIEEQLGSINESNDKGVDALVGHEESIVNNVDNSTVSFEMEKLTKPELSNLLNQSGVTNNENRSDSNNVDNSTVSFEMEKLTKPISSSVQEVETTDVEANSSDVKEVINEEKVPTNSNCPELAKPLNFDEFNSAAEMEVLGMERLKSELQERGLKCGGTLQERATRLFLLKTTPLEMLPKKLLAKK